MKIHRSLFAAFVAGIAALAVSSCAYDPYYSGGSSYSGGGYGSGYGYGNLSFSTSFFVSTGNPRWGYDPYAGAYYDYNRRCYYDPYLSGYYPTGYRPRYVYGSPHPHGWSRGRSYIAPPSRIRSYDLTNYRDRTSRYQNLGRDWSRNVRSAPSGRDQRPVQFHDQHRDSNRSENYAPRGDRGSRFESSRSGGFDRDRSDGDRSRGGFRGNTSVVAPQIPSMGDPRSSGRTRTDSNSASRQQMMDRMNQARQQLSDSSRPQMTPQIQRQPIPQPQVVPQDDDRRGGGGGFRGGGRGGNSPAPSGEGRGRGRGVRGLGEG